MISEVGQIFNDPTLNSLKLELEVTAARHEALASNVANFNTPGYHRIDLSHNFKDSFSAALQQLDQGRSMEEINMTGPQLAVDEMQNVPRMDGNTVNLEQETTEIIKNQADFDFAGRMLALKYSGLKQAISGTVT
jgi:flagellar basal-body rod protein FlgB